MVENGLVADAGEQRVGNRRGVRRDRGVRETPGQEQVLHGLQQRHLGTAEVLEAVDHLAEAGGERLVAHGLCLGHLAAADQRIALGVELCVDGVA